MMFDTPRVFVGTTTFLIAGLASLSDLQRVTAVINSFPGVRVVDADQRAGLISATAERPVNRADLIFAIIQAGYTVLA